MSSRTRASSTKSQTRKRVNFWLDLSRDEDHLIYDMVTWLKSQRKFTQTVRDGIRLMISLRERDFSVLYELFPGIVDSLENDLLRGALETIDELASEQRAMRAEMQRMNANAAINNQPVVKSKPTIQAKPKPKSGKGDAAKNLLKGLAGLS